MLLYLLSEEGIMNSFRSPKAFLSHSSKDKVFVRQVFEDLGALYCELDEITFEPGFLNSEVIHRALDRSSVFVLFASKSSALSSWVTKEIRSALNLYKNKKRIFRILIYCLDEDAFSLLDPELKDFNVVRFIRAPRICARQIRGVFCEIVASYASDEAYFVARDLELTELKKLLLNPEREFTASISISGFDRMGRRQVLKKLVQDLYPSFNTPQHFIVVAPEFSMADIYRNLISVQYVDLNQNEITMRFHQFTAADRSVQLRLITQEIEAIFCQREIVSFVDLGGIIDSSGDFSAPYREILDYFSKSRDPRVFFILSRSVPARYRNKYPFIVFLSLPPLNDEQARLYLWSGLRKIDTRLEPEVIDQFIHLADGHPANLDYIINSVELFGTEQEIMQNPADFVKWKRNRAIDYISKLSFTPPERRLVQALSIYRTLPAEFVGAILSDAENQSRSEQEEQDNAIRSLIDRNVVEAYSGQFIISRPLREAIERDAQFQMDRKNEIALAKKLSSIFSEYKTEDKVPVQLIDAAALAVVHADNCNLNWISSLVLPSHYIWMCRHCYNKREYKQAISHGKSALAQQSMLTGAAILEASRFLALACARVGLAEEFDRVVAEMLLLGTDEAKGSARFLRGFNFRLNGDFEKAEMELKAAKRILKGSANVMRELLYTLNVRQKYAEALELGETAMQTAESNAYIIDELVKTRIAMSADAKSLEYDSGFSDLMKRLEKYGNGPGASFYALRQVDLLLKQKKYDSALHFANIAIKYTKDLPSAYGARAKVYSAKRMYAEAEADLERMYGILNKSPQTLKYMYHEHDQLRFYLNLARRRYSNCMADLENIARRDLSLFDHLRRVLVHEAQRDKKISEATLIEVRRIAREPLQRKERI